MDFKKYIDDPARFASDFRVRSPAQSAKVFFRHKNAASYKTMRQIGGLEGDRTLDLSDANRTLSQLSYEPILLT